MMANPFAFYRGAVAIMAYDLSHTPNTGLKLQICGDCHLLNFGGFATTERKVIIDINDFDETSVAPWEWDIKRLTTSFVIADRASGFKVADCRQADCTPRIIDHPPLIFHYNDVRDAEYFAVAQEALARYRESLAPERRVLIQR